MDDPHPSAAKKQRLSGISTDVNIDQYHISSIDDFKEKSKRSNVVFCAPDVPDCYDLLEIFQCEDVGRRMFTLGLCESWGTWNNWPLVGALSIEASAPRLKGSHEFRDHRYENAIDAMVDFFYIDNCETRRQRNRDTFFVLDSVFYYNGQEKTMENVVKEALQCTQSFSAAEFLICRGKCKVKENNGDLFQSTESLAHCVSEDLKMGAGIAKKFKEKFDKVEELRCQRKTVGKVAVLKVNSRFIYYLVTKKNYYYKPTYRDVRNSLVEMRKHALSNNITNISMPAIGCGLDQLHWHRMKLIIKEVFLPTDIEINVYFLDEDVD